MTTVPVENLVFEFAPSVDPFQYEAGGVCVANWPPRSRVVDVVGNETPQVVWLVEAKDFRIITNPPRPTNLAQLAETVEAKVRDTLAALPVVAATSGDVHAQAHAACAISVGRYRVVLHLEPHPTAGSHARLFPPGFIANVLLKLRTLVSDIDLNPLVLDIAHTSRAQVPWSVQ